MTATTSWVRKPHYAKGLDPLAVQAPCINLYAQLVPGITNVTDRARYYSFYPWAVWAFDKTSQNRSHGDFIRWVRRADCLFTLIGIRHRIAVGDDNYLKHDAGLIGSQTLRPVVKDLGDEGKISLSMYATREEGNPKRYFKNDLGGLGQYYLGTFDALGLMARTGREVGYTPEDGATIAQAFDSSVSLKLFADTIEAETVSIQRLDELAEFCPCQLQRANTEHEALVDLFFDRYGKHGDAGRQRRATLGLILDLIASLHAGSDADAADFNQSIFRGCVYSGCLPGGEAWGLPDQLEKTRSGWGIYQRNELLSLAIQSVFWVALRSLEETEARIDSTESFASWFATTDSVTAASSAFGSKDFSGAVRAAGANLPLKSDWQVDDHEISLAHRLLEAYAAHKERDVKAELLTLAGRIIVALVARDDDELAPYDPMAFPPDYLSLYPVNLGSLRQTAAGVWHPMATRDWLGWLSGHWGVEAHLRVALRKLRYQSQDTFHIQPTDHGLKVIVLPDPTYTTPRFDTTTQILQDIGAIDRTPDRKQASVTELGKQLWELCRG